MRVNADGINGANWLSLSEYVAGHRIIDGFVVFGAYSTRRRMRMPDVGS